MFNLATPADQEHEPSYVLRLLSNVESFNAFYE